MSTYALAALYVETHAYAARDDYEHEYSVTGWVSWDPIAQEFCTSCVEIHLPPELARLREAEKIDALDTLATAAAKVGVGCCIACVARGGTKRQATCAAWLCEEHQAASPALVLVEARH